MHSVKRRLVTQENACYLTSSVLRAVTVSRRPRVRLELGRSFSERRVIMRTRLATCFRPVIGTCTRVQFQSLPPQGLSAEPRAHSCQGVICQSLVHSCVLQGCTEHLLAARFFVGHCKESGAADTRTPGWSGLLTRSGQWSFTGRVQVQSWAYDALGQLIPGSLCDVTGATRPTEPGAVDAASVSTVSTLVWCHR